MEAVNNGRRHEVRRWLRENIHHVPWRGAPPASSSEKRAAVVGALQGAALALFAVFVSSRRPELVWASASLAWLGLMLALRWERRSE